MQHGLRQQPASFHPANSGTCAIWSGNARPWWRNATASPIACEMLLEDANLKLASVASDLQGVTAQAILHALLAGQEDPHTLAGLARGRLRTKRTELERSLKGKLREHHRFLLTQWLA